MGCGTSTEAGSGVEPGLGREREGEGDGEGGAEAQGVLDGEADGTGTGRLSAEVLLGEEEDAQGRDGEEEGVCLEEELMATSRFFEELEEELALVESALGSAGDPGAHSEEAAEAAMRALEALGSPRRREARQRFGQWPSPSEVPGVEVWEGEELLMDWGRATKEMDRDEVEGFEACLSQLHMARMEVGVDGFGLRDLGRLGRPPRMVHFALDTVCICLGQPNPTPRRAFDPAAFAERNAVPLRAAGSWLDVRRRLNAPGSAFRDEVTGADLLSLRLLDAGVVAKVRKRLREPGFSVQDVQRATSSNALASLRRWLSAMVEAHDASLKLQGVLLGAFIDISRHPLAMHRIAQKCAADSQNPSPLLKTSNFRWMASLLAINRRIAHAKDVDDD